VNVTEDNDPFTALSEYPSTLVVIDRGLGMFCFRAEPLSTATCQLMIESFVLAGLADVPDIGADLIAAVAVINNEDTLINERTAAGLCPKCAALGRVSHLEAAPWHFRRWLVQRMGEST